MSSLELRTLGSLEILLGGQPLTSFKTRKVQALLIYLACHAGQSFSREHLQSLLWSESPPKQAAASLRQALVNLRGLLPEGMLRAELGSIAFRGESAYTLDVTDVAARPELYRGPFLQGFDIADAQGWEEWLFTAREQIQSRVLDQLEAQGQAAAAQGHFSAAIEFFRQMVRIDSWREDVYRALMRLYDLVGDRAAALAQYERCRAILAEEVGVEPTVETTALYQRILTREGGEATPASSPFSAPPAPPPELPFIGREDEYAQLLAAWEQAQRGQGGLTLIEGEAGLGKTRLAEDLLRHAASQGAAIFRGRCYEFGSGVPYQPIVEILRSLLLGAEADPFPRPQAALSPVWLAEVTALLPELRDAYPHLPPPVGMESRLGAVVEGEARQRLFEAVSQCLRAALVSRKRGEVWQPLALFLDDLHWIDQTTLDLFHYLIRRLSNTTLWFLGAYRREEMALEHPLLQMRRSLSRDRRVTLVRLTPLTEETIRRGVQALTGLGADATLRLGDYLGQESEGNPFILSELLYDLAERGDLRWSAQEKSWQLRPDWVEPQGNAAVPFAVREVILERLARLPRPSQELLRLAAVIGRGFDLPLLRQATYPVESSNPASPQLMVEASVEDWLARRLVRSEVRPQTQRIASATPVYVLDFAHDMIRAVVYQSTAPIQRGMLHQRVGDVLESIYAGELHTVYEQLAHHYEEAGRTEKALLYLPLAGDKSAKVYANAEALDYYARAMALLPPDDSRRWSLLLHQIELLRLVGEFDQAVTLCRQMVGAGMESAGDLSLASVPALWRARASIELGEIDLARRNYSQARAWAESGERLAEVAGIPDAQAQAIQLQAKVAREEGRLDAAQMLFEAALSLRSDEVQPQSRVDCLNGLGQILAGRGYYDAALTRFQEVLGLYRSLADQPNEAACLRTIGRIYWRQGITETAQEVLRKSLELCRAIGDRRGEAESISELGLVYISREEKAAARGCWEECVAILRSLGLEKRIAPALHNLGILAITQGDYATAQHHLEESLAINQAGGARPPQALDLGWLGLLNYQRGDYPTARDYLQAALALDAEMGGSEEAIWHLTWMGCVAYETGELAEAEMYLLTGLEQAEERGMDRRRHHIYHWLAAVYLAQGDGAAALDAAGQAIASVEAGANEHALLGVVYASGLVEQTDDPSAYFEQALAFDESNPFLQGMVLRRYGEYLLGAGQQEEGLAYLDEAQAILARIGARGELAKIEKALAR